MHASHACTSKKTLATNHNFNSNSEILMSKACFRILFSLIARTQLGCNPFWQLFISIPMTLWTESFKLYLLLLSLLWERGQEDEKGEKVQPFIWQCECSSTIFIAFWFFWLCLI